MTYPISPECWRLLDELDRLRSAARALLDLASAEAHEEWTKFESRCPSSLERVRGVISLSRWELEEMRSKASRFGEILEASRVDPAAPLRRPP
jgi:hypothetical protein